MKNITITCDRCENVIEGFIGKCPSTGNVITSGYYVVSDGNWKEFARDTEEYLCDDCMHNDPKYIEIYGI